MSEAPKCRMLLATNAEVLDQLTCIAVSPTPLLRAPFFVANLFINLAYSVDAHPHITQPHLMKRLLNICSTRTDFQATSDRTMMK